MQWKGNIFSALLRFILQENVYNDLGLDRLTGQKALIFQLLRTINNF